MYFEKEIIGAVGRRISFAAAVLLAAAAVFCAFVAVSPPAGVPILEYHMVDTQEDEEPVILTMCRRRRSPRSSTICSARDIRPSRCLTTCARKKASSSFRQSPHHPHAFDDGYEDNYTQMLPLEARGMRAVVFVVTNDIGQPDYLTWDELRDMSAAASRSAATRRIISRSRA